MILQGMPRYSQCDTQVFYASPSVTTTNSWQTWNKPNGCGFVFFLMLASGGGGGKPANGNITTSSGGGGAGGCTRLLVPAFLIPDRLYIRPGSGGLGATVAGAGTIGTTSYINIIPSAASTRDSVITQAGGGAGAQVTTGGTAGAADTTVPFNGVGVKVSIAGQVGGAGTSGANANGNAITGGNNGIISSGGAGGGNGTGNGGAQNLAFPWRAIAGGTGTTGGAGLHGQNMNTSLIGFGTKGAPVVYSGGTGGGGHGSGTAGRGGDGAYGSGGGGGGACTNVAGTSGNGGDGGDGFVIVVAW